MRALVVDASVAAKWVLNEPAADRARGLFHEWVLLAPELLWAELGSLLWRRQRMGEFDPAAAREMLNDLRTLPVTSFALRPLLPLALEISIALNHSVYDCIYLALSETESCALVTADERLLSAVGSSPFSISAVSLGSISGGTGEA